MKLINKIAWGVFTVVGAISPFIGADIYDRSGERAELIRNPIVSHKYNHDDFQKSRVTIYGTREDGHFTYIGEMPIRNLTYERGRISPLTKSFPKEDSLVVTLSRLGRLKKATIYRYYNHK